MTIMENSSVILSSVQSSLTNLLRTEIDAGIAASKDPENTGLADLADRITTMYSPWYTRTCPQCKLRFREEDRVRLCPQCGQAYHEDAQYQLHCWQTHFANGEVCKKGGCDAFTERDQPGCDYQWNGTFPEDNRNTAQQHRQSQRIIQVSSQFLHGLQAIWTPFGEEAIYEVKSGDRIIGYRCPWCRFLIRAGDHVVKCPCGNCETYFHDDIFRHLTCWNDWNGTRGHDYCPTTGARISGQ